MSETEDITSASLFYLKDTVMTDPYVKLFFINIGRQLKMLRGHKKILEEQFSERMGITTPQLAKIEGGEIWVEPEFYEQAARICGTSARGFIDSISSYELPNVLTRHRGLILAALTEQDRMNYEQYHRGCLDAVKQIEENEERKKA